MPRQKTLLPPEFAGVMYETGHRGVGKSWLAAQADDPDNIAYFDYEEKGSGIDSQLKFGKYHSMMAEVAGQHGAAFTRKHLFDYQKKVFEALPQDEFTVAILDNIQPFEEALAAEVRKTPQMYGIKPGNAESGAYGGVWPAVNDLVDRHVNLLYAKGIQLVIAIAHVKPAWVGGAPVPNKFRAKGVERWQDLSILTLIVIDGDHPPIPSALVQSEHLGAIVFDREKGEHVMRRRLPLRLPKATFAEIRRYLREPADLEHPEEGEVPRDGEMTPFQEKFSHEQLQYLLKAVPIGEQITEEVQP